MWIKWKYNDHGHPDFKELEIPDDTVNLYGSVEEYIEELGIVPSWSERYMRSRIKWEKIESPSQETIKAKITELKHGITWRQSEVERLSKLIL